MGATLLLAGLVCAIATAPLFDRVFTRHIARTCKLLLPALGALWLSLIWAGASPSVSSSVEVADLMRFAVKRGDTGGLFAICALIGACSVTLLPLAIELAIEVTRNADGSSAVLWFAYVLSPAASLHRR